MKKYVAILLATLILAGCTAPIIRESVPVISEIQTQPVETETIVSIEITVPVETTVPATTEPKEPIIKQGTWITHGGILGRFFVFDANGISGQTIAFKDGAAEKFIYKESDEGILFYTSGKEVPAVCHVTVKDDGTMTLEWENEIVEHLSYVGDLDAEHFHFYTEEELCRMALDDHKVKHDPDDTTLEAAAGDNGDGSVTIQIYQNLSDYNSTAAWYWVDRITGEGKIVGTEQPVDITNGTADLLIDYFDPSVHKASAFYECVVDESEYRSKVVLIPEVKIADLSVVALEAEEDGEFYGFRVKTELFHGEQMSAQKPLILYLELPETIPNVGIIYTDRYGETKTCTISMSGLDGAPLLIEERIVESK